MPETNCSLIRSVATTLGRGYQYCRAVRSPGPNYLILFVTARCNLRCPHCFYLEEIESAAKERELRLDEFERIARSLPFLLQLTCTGGETFVREDLDKIAEVFYRHSRTRFFTLTTNGTLVDRTVKTVESISRLCPGAVIRVPLSLDGVGEVHDRARGKQGTWEKTIECYRELRKLADRSDNIRIDITTVLSRLNEDNVEDLIRYVNENMEIENHTVLYARGAIRDRDKIVPSEIRYKDLVSRTFDRRRKKYDFPFLSRVFVRLRESVERAIVITQETGEMPFVCAAGERMIEMSEYGDIFPCEILDTLIRDKQADPQGLFDNCVMGNVRDHDYDVRKVMESARGREIRRLIQNKGCSCTFECAIGATIAFEPSNLGWLLKPWPAHVPSRIMPRAPRAS